MSTLNLLDYGLLKVSGHDAKKFLQSQLTCHVEEVTMSQSRMSAHCNASGRVISLFHLILWHQDYYLLMPRCLIDIALRALKKYALFDKVTLADVSDSLSCVGLQHEPSYRTLLTGQHDLIITALPSQPLRWFIIGAIDTIMALTTNLDYPFLSNHAWKQLDITAKLPTIYPQTSGKLLPNELHLLQLNAVSLNKGCYTGQEIIARIHYRGKLKKALYHARICHPSLPLPGSDIYYEPHTEKRVGGMVIDSCHIKNNDYETLIVVETENVKNQPLFLEHKQYFFRFAHSEEGERFS